MNEITIARFYPRKAYPKDWLQYHIFRKERHEEAEPDRSLLPDSEIEETKKKEHPFGDIYEWVARGDGVIIANAVTFIQRPDTPGYTERARYLASIVRSCRAGDDRALASKCSGKFMN